MVSSFLAGSVGVPQDLLRKVSPALLATLFQNIPDGLTDDSPLQVSWNPYSASYALQQRQEIVLIVI